MSDENNLNAELSFEDGDFLGADIQVEDRAFGPQFPVAQWVNGSAKNKRQGGVAYTGGIFISADQGIAGDKLKAAGFEPYSFVTNDGTEIAGYAATEVTLAILRYRRCWQVKADGQLAQRFGWDEFDAAQEVGDPRGISHLLVVIQGIDEPILLSFRGMTARRMMGQGKDRGVVPEFSRLICGSAKRIARAAHKEKNYPLCTFRLTLAPESDGKQPKFTEVGKGDKKNSVTFPVWKDRPTGEVDQALLGRLFVGNERLAQYQDWHKDGDEWVDAWNSDTLQSFRNNRSSGRSSAATPTDGTPSENQVVL